MDVGLQDQAVQQRLQTLVTKACNKQRNALEPAVLADIKQICRLRDDYVQAAWEELSQHLRAPHAQVCAARAAPTRRRR